MAKAFDGSAVLGKFIKLNETEDAESIGFSLKVNGKEVQKGNTADMLFNVNRIIEYVSRFVTLKMGDLIYTGTPEGVGPVKIGDQLEGYIGEKKLFDFEIK
jgi:2-keto-4-pentenoate hydratase/2-oxohepta-3-ene-1,7-dioic acid hydratase in catechol pathway